MGCKCCLENVTAQCVFELRESVVDVRRRHKADAPVAVPVVVPREESPAVAARVFDGAKFPRVDRDVRQRRHEVADADEPSSG